MSRRPPSTMALVRAESNESNHITDQHIEKAGVVLDAARGQARVASDGVFPDSIQRVQGM